MEQEFNEKNKDMTFRPKTNEKINNKYLKNEFGKQKVWERSFEWIRNKNTKLEKEKHGKVEKKLQKCTFNPFLAS